MDENLRIISEREMNIYLEDIWLNSDEVCS